MYRRLAGLGVAALLALIDVGCPSAASAAAFDVAQPQPATLAQSYSFQITDAVLGTPTLANWTAGGNGCAVASNYEPGMPAGLSMSQTGLISGTPTLPEQTEFCAELQFAGGLNEEVQMTMTVGSGNATLDAVIVPAGTTLAGLLDNANPILLGTQRLLEGCPCR